MIKTIPFIIATSTLIAISAPVAAKPEPFYRDRFCSHGETEKRLQQGGTHVRLDCLTRAHAIEV